MASSLVNCTYCGKDFLKDNRHINENIKFGHNFYCSRQCEFTFKTKQKEFVCEYRKCKNKFKRSPKDISPHNFCSRSCAVTFRNEQKWGIKKTRRLLTDAEKREIWAKAIEKYWKSYQPKYNREDVILEIQSFVRRNGRIPVKKEVWRLYKPARKYFGTWNNAIEAAGFEPNPVMFAKHQIANDGHICDSVAEKIIDDYLFEKGISHERNVPYPEGEYTADFKVGNKLIEYFGLAGEHKRYDELRKIKQRIVKSYNLSFAEIYPNNLYPTNKLEEILGI